MIRDFTGDAGTVPLDASARCVYVVTGTRSPDFCKKVEFISLLRTLVEAGGLLILGDARGIDMWAREFCQGDGTHAEMFVADWIKFKGGAGGVRNGWMVDRAIMYRDAGLDVVGLAFPKGCRTQSPGSWDCMEKMVTANINIHVVSGFGE